MAKLYTSFAANTCTNQSPMNTNKRRPPGMSLKREHRIRKLNAFINAVVHETENVVYVCREKICSNLGLPLTNFKQRVKLDSNKLIREMFGEHRKITIVYPLVKALQTEKCGQKELVYFTCTECDRFSTVVYWRLKLRPSEATQSCTKCFRRTSQACAERTKKWLAGRQRSWDVYKQDKPQAKPFTISDSFKAMIQRTYCQQQSPPPSTANTT